MPHPNPMGTGVFDITERATGTSAIVPLGTKELTCSTAGTYPIQSKTAYGEWIFNVNKGADGNATYIYINSNIIDIYPNINGYLVYFTNTEAMRLSAPAGATENIKFATAASYIANNTDYRIKVARLKSEGVFKDIQTLQTSDMINNPNTTYDYDTFTSNGRYGFSAVGDGSTIHIAGTADEISIVNTKKYLVEFNLKLNSGTVPDITLATAFLGSQISNKVTTTNGRNSIVLTATSTSTGVCMFLNSSTATDYEISGLTIRRIYDADSFAVFIKGGAYGNTETGWTLVTPSSGSNPIVDSTYTTSEFTVLDLDQSDRISNISIKNEVEQ